MLSHILIKFESDLDQISTRSLIRIKALILFNSDTFVILFFSLKILVCMNKTNETQKFSLFFNLV